MELSGSHAALRRAESVIPLGTQTMSKHASQFVGGVSPLFLERGRGAHMWDVDGNEFVDFPMALGPVILGYAEPVVDDAVRAQLDQGITFSLSHPLEAEVAERIIALCPGVEAVRFAKSGSDAVSGAVRAARALTGRDLILAAGYHGWHDWYIGSTTLNRGVPDRSRPHRAFPYDDVDHLLESSTTSRSGRGGDHGAVRHVAERGHLQAVGSRREHGILPVFDEIITGFRFAPGGLGNATTSCPTSLLRQGAGQRLADRAIAGAADNRDLEDSSSRAPTAARPSPWRRPASCSTRWPTARSWPTSRPRARSSWPPSGPRSSSTASPSGSR